MFPLGPDAEGWPPLERVAAGPEHGSRGVRGPCGLHAGCGAERHHLRGIDQPRRTPAQRPAHRRFRQRRDDLCRGHRRRHDHPHQGRDGDPHPLRGEHLYRRHHGRRRHPQPHGDPGLGGGRRRRRPPHRHRHDRRPRRPVGGGGGTRPRGDARHAIGGRQRSVCTGHALPHRRRCRRPVGPDRVHGYRDAPGRPRPGDGGRRPVRAGHPLHDPDGGGGRHGAVRGGDGELRLPHPEPHLRRQRRLPDPDAQRSGLRLRRLDAQPDRRRARGPGHRPPGTALHRHLDPLGPPGPPGLRHDLRRDPCERGHGPLRDGLPRAGGHPRPAALRRHRRRRRPGRRTALRPGTTLPAAFSADLPGRAPVLGAVPARLVEPEGFAFWGQGFGAFGSAGGNGNAARLDQQTSGFVLGADTASAPRGAWAWPVATPAPPST